MREHRGEEGAGRCRPTSRDGAALLTSPSTRHPDAALGLLVGVRRAWGPLLPLGIRIWAPNWTQMLNKHWLDLPLQRNCVRLSPYSLLPSPTPVPRTPYSASPHLPFTCGSGNLGGARLRDTFLHVGQRSPLQITYGAWRGAGDVWGISHNLFLSRDPAPPTEALTCSTELSGVCAWSRRVWSAGT